MPKNKGQKDMMVEYMGMLYGQGIPESKGIKKKALALICMQRSLVAIMGPLMFLLRFTLIIEEVEYENPLPRHFSWV